MNSTAALAGSCLLAFAGLLACAGDRTSASDQPALKEPIPAGDQPASKVAPKDLHRVIERPLERAPFVTTYLAPGSALRPTDGQKPPLQWPERMHTGKELDALLVPIAEAWERAPGEDGEALTRLFPGARRKLGRFALRIPSSDKLHLVHNAQEGYFDLRTNGQRAVELSIPIVFAGDPLLRGEMALGSNSLQVWQKPATARIAIPAADAAAFQDRHSTPDAFEEHYLIELTELDSFDNAPYVRGRLHAVRLVSRPQHQVLYDSLVDARPVTAAPPK